MFFSSLIQNVRSTCSSSDIYINHIMIEHDQVFLLPKPHGSATDNWKTTQKTVSQLSQRHKNKFHMSTNSSFKAEVLISTTAARSLHGLSFFWVYCSDVSFMIKHNSGISDKPSSHHHQRVQVKWDTSGVSWVSPLNHETQSLLVNIQSRKKAHSFTSSYRQVSNDLYRITYLFLAANKQLAFKRFISPPSGRRGVGWKQSVFVPLGCFTLICRRNYRVFNHFLGSVPVLLK